MKNSKTRVVHPDWSGTNAGFLAAVAVLLLAQAGCGIPATRRALSGPEMPPNFSLNNAAPRWNQMGPLDYYRAVNPANNPRLDSVTPTTGTGDSSTKTLASVASASPPPPDVRKQPTIQPISYTTDNSEMPEAVSAIGVQDSVGLVDPSSTDAPDLAIPPFSPGSESQPAQSEGDGTVVENATPLPVGMYFEDPYLLELFDLALAGNQELRILSEEINIASNEVYARSGEYRPFVFFGSGAGLEKSSRFSRAGAVEDQLEGAPGKDFPEPLPDFLVATNVSWELDIWKKLRNAQGAAAMRFLGTRDGRNYIVTRLIAEVAENYYELLALDNRLTTLQKTIEIQEQSLKVAESMKAAGRGTELAVQRFQGEVRKNQSELLVIRQEIVEAENRINLLVGRYPQPVERSSVDYFELQLKTLSAGLPSDLLQNRADIRQAERKVTAAGLDLRVARARFYPSLGLRAGVGLNAFNTGYLLSTPESLIYNVALDLVGPLINKRAIKADYCSANAAQLQAIYDYQRTVLTAHIEVVNFLTKVDNYRQSIDFKTQQLAALEASVDAATKLFQSARAEYIEVLLAQREMMEARLDLIETKRQQLQAIVEAYQALGGGASFAFDP